MAANTVGINEPGSPNKLLASQSFTRSAQTVHQEEVVLGNGTTDGTLVGITPGSALRTQQDWRINATAKRFQLAMTFSGTTNPGANLYGLRHLNGQGDAYIHFLQVHLYHALAAVATPLTWTRAQAVASGTLVAAVDVPELDSAGGNPTVEIRLFPTAVKANQDMFVVPASTVAAPAANTGAGIIWEWRAFDLADRIRLTADEGFVLDQMFSGSVGQRWSVTVAFEEV